MNNSTNAATRNRILRGAGQAVALARSDSFERGANIVLKRQLMTQVLLNSQRLDEIKFAIRHGGDATGVTTRAIQERLQGANDLGANDSNTLRILLLLVKAGAGADVVTRESSNTNVRGAQRTLCRYYIEHGNQHALRLLQALLDRGYTSADLESHFFVIFPLITSEIERWITVVQEYCKRSKENDYSAIRIYFSRTRISGSRVSAKHVERLLKAGAKLNDLSYYTWLKYAKSHAGDPDRGLNPKILAMFRKARASHNRFRIFTSVVPNLTGAQVKILRAHGFRDESLPPVKHRRKQRVPSSTR